MILERSVPEPNSGCWLWLGALNSQGYARILRHGKHQIGSRISYAAFYGDDPGDRFVLHKCDIPICVNPDHLFLGSPADNSADMKNKGRSLYGERNARAKITEQQARAIRMDDRPAHQIADDYGVTATLVRSIKIGKAWRHLTGPAVKSRPYNKLSAEDRAAIRAATGRQIDIARQFGISQVRVSQIKRAQP